VRVDVGHLGDASPAGTFFRFRSAHLLTLGPETDRLPQPARHGGNLTATAKPVNQDHGPRFRGDDWTGRELRVGSDLALR